jgi:subtilisin family serine protease
MMEVTVKDKYLNVRVGQPSVNAPCNKSLGPASKISVEGLPYKGDLYDGIDTWLKDDGGNYYWSGGVNSSTTTNPIISTTESDVNAFTSIAQFSPELINWNARVIKLPANIRNSLGNGINVAVLDSGVEKKQLDLAQNLVESRDFTIPIQGDLDVEGHGTEMASLIAASAFCAGKGIIGVAPNAKIYSAKVIYDQGDPGDFASVGRSLDYLLRKEIDIVNMSIGRPPDNPLPPIIQGIADKIANANKTIFFAATEESSIINSPSDLLQMFPANCPVVIPVCALTKEQLDNYWDNLPAPLIIVPLFNAWCCSIQYRKFYFQQAGSSVSTAFVSGITALILSNNPSISRTKPDILAELGKYSSTADEAFRNPGPEIHIIVKQ